MVSRRTADTKTYEKEGCELNTPTKMAAAIMPETDPTVRSSRPDMLDGLLLGEQRRYSLPNGAANVPLTRREFRRSAQWKTCHYCGQGELHPQQRACSDLSSDEKGETAFGILDIFSRLENSDPIVQQSRVPFVPHLHLCLSRTCERHPTSLQGFG
jgi:hypothetical protein